ncbi:hypothetical protein ABT354_00180 [Streptomyces sp. NPDC000594]|uniref:hypothetical protein n=1 Tax=Streptomyces sp. NPDC000594 TaxID=3154261 RepID=UPI003318414F
MSDEEWERFLQESVEGVPDAPSEPSARARTVARRLRENPAEPAPWRAYSPAQPKRRTGWYVAGLLASVAVLVAVLLPGGVTDWFGGGDGARAAGDERTAAGTPPAGAAAAGTEQRPTREEPFRGSPAARWASGTAGIALPTARATGWMSEAQVARALERTREFLAASSLDPEVLRGGRPGRAIEMINPHQRDVQDFLSASFRAPDRDDDPLTLFSRFDPERARPLGDDIRTRGRLTFREGDDGALRVAADVTFVYPVTRAAGGDEVARTIVRREVVVDWDTPARVVTKPGTLSLVSHTVHTTNGGCGPVTGYLRPRFGTPAASGTDGGPAVDPYDRSTPMAERMRRSGGEECGTATRS